MGCILKDTDRRWEGPIVPFTIDANLTNPQRVTQAMAAWENVTGVRFVARDAQEDYVHFRHGQDACHSDTGRKGGKQFVTLLPDCGVAAIVHELGHTLGCKHEHQRPDRDEFVTVHTDNIQPGKEHDFEKLPASDVLLTLDTAGDPVYDFQSIMHYPADAFSIDPALHTIDPNPPNQNAVLDNSTSPTALDAQIVSDNYNTSLGVVRRSDSGVGAAGHAEGVAVATILQGLLITAVRTAAGKLKLIPWRVDSNGGITRMPDSGDQGSASDIGIAAGQRVVTAFRAASHKLQLISWDFTNGQLQLAGEGNDASEASLIQIVALTPAVFLVACRSSNGHLLMSSWRLNANGSLDFLDEKLGTDSAGEISLAVVRPRLDTPVPTALVATTIRAGNGRAKVVTWTVVLLDTDGTIAFANDSGNQIGEATQIASAVAPSGHLIVSCRNGSGKLELISLEVSETGVVNRKSDSGSQAGEISLNALTTRPQGVLSAVKAGSGALKLINWRVGATGEISRTGDSSDQAGAVDRIVLGTANQTNAPVVTAIQRGDGNLALISWDDNSAHGEL